MSSENTASLNTKLNLDLGMPPTRSNYVERLKDVKNTIFTGLKLTDVDQKSKSSLDLFEKYDTNKDGVINKEENLNYEIDKKNEAMTNEFMKLAKENPKELYKRISNKSFKALGIEKEMKGINDSFGWADIENTFDDSVDSIYEFFGGKPEQKDIKNMSQYLKLPDQFNENNIKTKDDFTNAIIDTYSTETDDPKSIYQMHIERIKNKELTDSEKLLINKNEDISPEKLAKIATNSEQFIAIMKIVAKGDTEVKEAAIGTLSSLDPMMQTAIISNIIYSCEDEQTKNYFANMIINNSNLEITDVDEYLSNIAMIGITKYSDRGATQQAIINNDGMKMSGNTDSKMLIASDIVDKDRVKSGKITQKQYNEQYSTLTATAATKTKKSNTSIRYIIKNINKDNAESTMESLAENVYKIKNKNEREKALKSMQESEHYTKEIKTIVDDGREKYLTLHPEERTDSSIKTNNNKTSTTNLVNENQKLNNDLAKQGTINNSTSITKATNEKLPNNYVSDPIESKTLLHNDTNYDDYLQEDKITEIMNNGSTDEQVSLINTVISNAEKADTPKKRGKSGKSASVIMNLLVKGNYLKDSKIEAAVTKYLARLSVPTLINIFSSCSQKAQNYMYTKGFISKNALLMRLSQDQINNLGDKVKDSLENTNEQLRNKNMEKQKEQ